MSDFNILSVVGFRQPDISARSRTVCLLSLLMADSTFVTLPVLLSSGLPISSAAGFSSRNLESNLYSKAVMHSGDVRVALLKINVSSGIFLDSNQYCITVRCSPRTSDVAIFSPLELDRLFLIACRHFVNDVIALKFCDNTHNLMRFTPISIFYGYLP